MFKKNKELVRKLFGISIFARLRIDFYRFLRTAKYLAFHPLYAKSRKLKSDIKKSIGSIVESDAMSYSVQIYSKNLVSEKAAVRRKRKREVQN